MSRTECLRHIPTFDLPPISWRSRETISSFQRSTYIITKTREPKISPANNRRKKSESKENPPERLFDRRLFPEFPSSGSLGTSSRIFGALVKSNGTTSSVSALTCSVGVDGVSLISAFLVRLRFFWRCPTTTIVSSTTSALTVCLRGAGTNEISAIAPSIAAFVIEVSTTSAEETTAAGGGAWGQIMRNTIGSVRHKDRTGGTVGAITSVL
jgi:hypothetical protein